MSHIKLLNDNYHFSIKALHILLVQLKLINMLGELNKDEINNLLTSNVIGRLACSKDNIPYIVPVTYTFDGEYIYGQTNEGEKLNILRQNPNVCFEIDSMLNMRQWQSVVVTGKFEELTEDEANKAKDIFFGRVYTLMTSSTIHLHQHDTTAEVDDTNRLKNIMYRIKIEKISGRFERE